MDVSENRGTPKSSHFNRVFHYKSSILGYPYFWKHPYTTSWFSLMQGQGWTMGGPAKNDVHCGRRIDPNHTPQKTNEWQWKSNHEWRCISYSELGDFPACHVGLQGCSFFLLLGPAQFALDFPKKNWRSVGGNKFPMPENCPHRTGTFTSIILLHPTLNHKSGCFCAFESESNR